MNHRETIDLLHDYDIEELDAAQRVAVEEHLASCEDCMELAELSRALRDAAVARSQGHPPAADIVAYAMHPADLEGAHKSGIESHLSDCPGCTNEVYRIRDMEAAIRKYPDATLPQRKTIPVGWLAAAATVAVALLCYPAYLGLIRLPAVDLEREEAVREVAELSAEAAGKLQNFEDFNGIVDLQVLSPSVRGQGDRSQITVRSGAPFALLAIELLVPREISPDATLEFKISRDGEEPVWSYSSTTGEVREAVRARGALILAVPVTGLNGGAFELTVHHVDLEAEPLATLVFDLRRIP